MLPKQLLVVLLSVRVVVTVPLLGSRRRLRLTLGAVVGSRKSDPGIADVKHLQTNHLRSRGHPAP